MDKEIKGQAKNKGNNAESFKIYTTKIGRFKIRSKLLVEFKRKERLEFIPSLESTSKNPSYTSPKSAHTSPQS